MIEFDELQSMHLVSWFSYVVTFRVSFPFDEILESSGLPITSVVNDALHFIFFFTIN